MKKNLFLLIVLTLSLACLSGCDDRLTESPSETVQQAEDTVINSGHDELPAIDENGTYSSKDEVALYIHVYGKLPRNYITKKEATAKGWNSGKNTVAEILPGMSIGGDSFGNYEKLLPIASERVYKECDIDYVEGGRNAKRIVYSNDGLIFYTEDHYVTFEQLYTP